MNEIVWARDFMNERKRERRVKREVREIGGIKTSRHHLSFSKDNLTLRESEERTFPFHSSNWTTEGKTHLSIFAEERQVLLLIFLDWKNSSGIPLLLISHPTWQQVTTTYRTLISSFKSFKTQRRNQFLGIVCVHRCSTLLSTKSQESQHTNLCIWTI